MSVSKGDIGQSIRWRMLVRAIWADSFSSASQLYAIKLADYFNSSRLVEREKERERFLLAYVSFKLACCCYCHRRLLNCRRRLSSSASVASTTSSLVRSWVQPTAGQGDSQQTSQVSLATLVKDSTRALESVEQAHLAVSEQAGGRTGWGTTQSDRGSQPLFGRMALGREHTISRLIF